ncbi:hypothetical protein JW968_05430 [Candidatus Woesearchaeota archaeon]|nr:hypothetical protein [Candidatus Woesearchaeota archaeon]
MMETNRTNITVDREKGRAIIKVNAQIYNKDIVLNAAYVFLDKHYVLIDGNPEDEISVELIPKDGSDPEKAALEFSNELVNYAEYHAQQERNKSIRDMIVHRALYGKQEQAKNEQQ